MAGPIAPAQAADLAVRMPRPEIMDLPTTLASWAIRRVIFRDVPQIPADGGPRRRFWGLVLGRRH